MDARIEALETVEECDRLKKKFLSEGLNDLAAQARLRKVQLKTQRHLDLDSVEQKCIEALYAYEEILAERNGKGQSASRTWPMIEKYGILGMVEKVVNRKDDPDGYRVLVQMGLEEYSFEAVVINNPERFSAEALKRSLERLNIEQLETRNQWSDSELQDSVIAYLSMIANERAAVNFTKKHIYEKLSDKYGRTPKAYEYRMQNISYVLSLMGRQWLRGLKPAKNVGRNIAIKIEQFINEFEDVKSSSLLGFEYDVLHELNTANISPPEGNPNPKRSLREVTVYDRDPKVKAWVLKRAGGKCESCKKPAPFTSTTGEPYLEVHHVSQIADQGPDTIENAVAICPNCHREIHHGMNAPFLIKHLQAFLIGLK